MRMLLPKAPIRVTLMCTAYAYAIYTLYVCSLSVCFMPLIPFRGGLYDNMGEDKRREREKVKARPNEGRYEGEGGGRKYYDISQQDRWPRERPEFLILNIRMGKKVRQSGHTFRGIIVGASLAFGGPVVSLRSHQSLKKKLSQDRSCTSTTALYPDIARPNLSQLFSIAKSLRSSCKLGCQLSTWQKYHMRGLKTL